MRKTAKSLTVSALLLTTCTLGCRTRGVVEPPPIEMQAAAVPAGTSLTLGLTECLQAARERQPRIAVQLASLAAAKDAERALINLHIPASLDPQVPIRREQSGLGVAAAAAGVDEAQRQTAYAVIRTYVTVVYAREQERVAHGVVERLTATRDAAQRALDAGDREVNSTEIQKTTVYLRLAETRQIQAAQGVKRALAGLREAIGFGPEVTIDIPAASLPVPAAQVNRNEVLNAALTRRSELIQARLFAQVACLEIDAQLTSFGQRMQTFAAGSDVHAVVVPQGSNATDYRPGAVPPLMPSLLVGSRSERVKHAEDLQVRAESAVDSTRNLIALEIDDAFSRWEEASGQARKAKEAADEGDKMAESLRKSFTAGLKVKVEDVVTSRVLASQARSEYNEFLFKQIIALADLERATAGGFNAGLVESFGGPIKSVPDTNKKP
jgi:outer membrane protein TolC